MFGYTRSTGPLFGSRDLSVALGAMFVYSGQIAEEEERPRFLHEMGRGPRPRQRQAALRAVVDRRSVTRTAAEAPLGGRAGKPVRHARQLLRDLPQPPRHGGAPAL